VTVAGTIGLGSSAYASDVGPGESAHVREIEGVTFHTEPGVHANWESWTSAFPVPLPPGIAFPSAPTSFFESTVDGGVLFEEGLPQAILSRFARCAWLDVALSEDASRPDLRAQALDELSRFAEYPGVAAGLDVTGYEEGVRLAAARDGLSPYRWEHDTECAPVAAEDGAPAGRAASPSGPDAAPSSAGAPSVTESGPVSGA
jgi:hypothetical protein